MTATEDVRPHLTDARVKAGETYKRRQARTAIDTLLEIDPRLWDEATRGAIVRTLPKLARIESWEIRALESGPRIEAREAPAWCEVRDANGQLCQLPAGHIGDHDPAYSDDSCGICAGCDGGHRCEAVHDNGDYRA